MIYVIIIGFILIILTIIGLWNYSTTDVREINRLARLEAERQFNKNKAEEEKAKTGHLIAELEIISKNSRIYGSEITLYYENDDGVRSKKVKQHAYTLRSYDYINDCYKPDNNCDILKYYKKYNDIKNWLYGADFDMFPKLEDIKSGKATPIYIRGST